MAYSDSSFSFSPTEQFTFNPSGNAVNNAPSPFGVGDNPYVAGCGDTSLVRDTYRAQVDEYVKLYGQTIAYQPAKYNYNTHNFLYGEDPTSGYHAARYMKAIIDFQQYSSFLTKFGYMSDVELTIYIPFSEFERVWGPAIGQVFPLAQDIFFIVGSSCDRPLKQTPMVFEVSDKHDSIQAVDYMGGHYVWKLTCKRFDFSYEPKATEERFLDEESEDSGKSTGRQAGGENPPDLSNSPWNVNEFAKGEFDNKESGTYGKYL